MVAPYRFDIHHIFPNELFKRAVGCVVLRDSAGCHTVPRSRDPRPFHSGPPFLQLSL